MCTQIIQIHTTIFKLLATDEKLRNIMISYHFTRIIIHVLVNFINEKSCMILGYQHNKYKL